ncbi:hypothetical protein V8C86DRAFT_3129258 [Haematococcus lacustris]
MSVDDDIINQVVAEQLRTAQNWRMVKAHDGRACLDMIEAAQVLPDLILLDVMMPGMSGYEVCTRLRKKYSSALLPIIMVSACCAEKDVVQAFRLGADDYVMKPYKRTELTERIKAHVRARDAAKGFDDLAEGVLDGTLCSVEGRDPAPTLLTYPACLFLVTKLAGLVERLHGARLAGRTAKDSQLTEDSVRGSCGGGHCGGAAPGCPDMGTANEPRDAASLLSTAGSTSPDEARSAPRVAGRGCPKGSQDVGAAIAFMERLQQRFQAVDSPAAAVAWLSPTSLLAAAAACWPDATPMALSLVLHCGPAQLLQLPATSAPCLPSAAWLLGLADMGVPGCILASEPARARLSQQVVWQPWPRTVTQPEAQSKDVAEVPHIVAASAALALGVGAAAADRAMACSNASMGGFLCHRGPLRVESVPGAAAAAAAHSGSLSLSTTQQMLRLEIKLDEARSQAQAAAEDAAVLRQQLKEAQLEAVAAGAERNMMRRMIEEMQSCNLL